MVAGARAAAAVSGARAAAAVSGADTVGSGSRGPKTSGTGGGGAPVVLVTTEHPLAIDAGGAGGAGFGCGGVASVRPKPSRSCRRASGSSSFLRSRSFLLSSKRMRRPLSKSTSGSGSRTPTSLGCRVFQPPPCALSWCGPTPSTQLPPAEEMCVSGAGAERAANEPTSEASRSTRTTPSVPSLFCALNELSASAVSAAGGSSGASAGCSGARAASAAGGSSRMDCNNRDSHVSQP